MCSSDLITMAIIAIFYPEGYIFSETQIIKILQVYDMIEDRKFDLYRKLKLNKIDLYNYLTEVKEILREEMEDTK